MRTAPTAVRDTVPVSFGKAAVLSTSRTPAIRTTETRRCTGVPAMRVTGMAEPTSVLAGVLLVPIVAVVVRVVAADVNEVVSPEVPVGIGVSKSGRLVSGGDAYSNDGSTSRS